MSEDIPVVKSFAIIQVATFILYYIYVCMPPLLKWIIIKIIYEVARSNQFQENKREPGSKKKQCQTGNLRGRWMIHWKMMNKFGDDKADIRL